MSCNTGNDMLNVSLDGRCFATLSPNDTCKVFMTQDYVGTSSIAMGDLTYFFVRREDIAYYRYTKTKSTTANPLKAAYFYDICDMNKKKMTGGLADTREQFEELVGLLKEAQPAAQEL